MRERQTNRKINKRKYTQLPSNQGNVKASIRLATISKSDKTKCWILHESKKSYCWWKCIRTTT